MAPAAPPTAVAAVRTVRLQLALASAFTAVAVCLAGVMGGLTYLSNRDLAIDTAHEAMRQSSRQIVSGVGQRIAQVTRVVSALARHHSADPHTALDAAALAAFFEKTWQSSNADRRQDAADPRTRQATCAAAIAWNGQSGA